MRKSTRLAQGNHGQSPEPTGAVGPAPRTPHHPKSGAVLKQLIQSLEAKWQLGLKVHEHQSPAQTRTTADKIKARIQYLFFSSRPALDEALEKFEASAAGFAPEEHVYVLDGLLKSKQFTKSPQSRIGIPVGTQNQPPKSLLSAEQTSQSRGRLREESRYDQVESCTTAIEPGSPTDADTDDEFVTPRSQSPSPSCRSTHRRLKASPSVSLQPNDRKRPLDGSGDSGRSPKLTKFLKGKQSAGPSLAPISTPPLFKKPPLGVRPYQNGSTSFSSVNTSFNTTAASSQGTKATSVNTSFTSYDGATELDRQRLDEKEAFTAENLRESICMLSQNQSHDSNSTFGSTIDDDALLEVTYQAEQGLMPGGPSATSASTHIGTTAVTGASSNSILQECMPPTASFPPAGPFVDYPDLEEAEGRRRSSSVGPKPNISPAKSPSKLAYYIRNLPLQNIFVAPIPAGFSLPFFILFICCRLSNTNDVLIETLLQRVKDDAVYRDPKLFWSAINGIIESGTTEPGAVWTASRKAFEGYTFKAKVSFTGRSSQSVFKLEPSPIQAERSCQLQRMFGSDRFLYLAFPSFSENRPDRFTQDEMSQIEFQWKLWLMEEHSFLNRMWRAFWIEPRKRRNTQRKDDDSDRQVVLFATEGQGIRRPMSVGQMLDEFIPLDENQKQNFCKAHARVALGLTRTIPAFVFKPSQIRRVKDKVSDGTPEEDEFNDKNFDWSEKCGEPPVMNDGCARISVGAALKIWEMYRSVTGSDEPFPSAFQGRIRGAKGMWMVSAEAHTRDQEHKDIWIEISDSQSKFEPHQEDEDDRTFNTHRLTFNYVKHSFVNGRTDLHISFIPILANRGVERDVIAEFMIKHLDVERTLLLERLFDPVELHKWVMKQSSATSGVITWDAALPVTLSEKVKLLLEVGFTPQESPYLAKVLGRFIEQRHSVMEQKLRAPLGSATFLLGLADPTNVLEPGQVHINFSSPFVDEFSRQAYRHLDGLEILVARQPACRPSDIQKVRVVAHPKLTHLRDVIVFPTRGQYPLAEKLQGGDYDGDTFWICWENDLVEPFKNAPAPLNPPDLSKYGIKKDTRKINEVMDPRDLSNNSVDGFLREAFKFRIAPSLLGKATNYLEKIAYRENRISSPKIDALCDVHDLLVDAPKQAYHFTDDDFQYLVHHKLRCGSPRVPAYKQAMEASTNNRAIDGKKDMRTYGYNPDNIIDHLYFDIIRKHNNETVQQLSAALPKDQEDDETLQLPFTQLRDKGVLKADLRGLQEKFERIVQDWNRGTSNRQDLPRDTYSKLLQSCYASFRAITLSPASTSNPEVAALVYHYFGPDHPTLWETIRASAFYTMYPKKGSLVWLMAGRELARLKASGNPHTRNVVPDIFANLKAKPLKVPKAEDGEQEEDDEDDEDVEDAFESLLEGEIV
ncbi:hypothetical protein J1614_007078 [Plenodomus biglobosus]|nr:hypothetical protein J1614_007078 [Plenodomus biglobosus]